MRHESIWFLREEGPYWVQNGEDAASNEIAILFHWRMVSIGDKWLEDSQRDLHCNVDVRACPQRDCNLLVARLFHSAFVVVLLLLLSKQHIAIGSRRFADRNFPTHKRMNNTIAEA